MTDWYYGRKGQHKGPVSLEQLQGLVSTGRILPTDLAWHEGLPDWTATQAIPDLSAATAAASAEVWYYGQGGEQQGPTCVLELRKMVATGSVGSDWLAWKEGMDEWTAISGLPPFAGIKKGVQKRATTKHEAQVASVSDADLVAGFRKESKPIAAAEEIKGLFKSAKRTVRIKKLQFEISGMEKTLQQEYIAVGQQVLESGEDATDITVERLKLKELLAEINERQERVNAVAGSSGTGAIRRELQGEINELNEQSQDVFEAIGKKSLAGGCLPDEAKAKITNLEEIVGERREAVQALLGVEAPARRLATGWLVGVGIVVLFAAAVGFFLWGGVSIWQSAFGDRLAVNRYVLPPNTNAIFYFNASVASTEIYKEIAEHVDSDMLLLEHGHGIKSDNDDLEIASTLIGFVVHDDEVPWLSVLHVESPAELKKKSLENFEEVEHEGQSYWATKNNSAEPSTRYLTEDQLMLISVQRGTSSVTVDQIVEFTEERIEQLQGKRESKSYKKLSKFLADVPDAHAAYLQTELKANDELFLLEVVDFTVNSMLDFNMQLTMSEVHQTLSYIKPEDSPKDIDDDVEAVVAALTFGESLQAEERTYFSSVGNAKDYVDLLETKLSDSKTEVKDKDFSGSDTLKVNVRKLLGSAEIVREEKVVILRCVIPSRLITKVLDDAKPTGG